MAGSDFTMHVGEFVQLEDTNGDTCAVNTAQITTILRKERTWRVQMADGTHVELADHVAHAFMNRLAGFSTDAVHQHDAGNGENTNQTIR